MPKNQFLDDTRRAIISAITELQLDIDKLKSYQVLIDELEVWQPPVAKLQEPGFTGTVDLSDTNTHYHRPRHHPGRSGQAYPPHFENQAQIHSQTEGGRREQIHHD